MATSFKTQSFSIVIPSYNEGKNITKLYNEILSALPDNTYEIIYVDDASTDDSNTYYEILKEDPKVKIIKQKFNSGQSSCLSKGVNSAKNNIIVTLDGDCQNDPNDILSLFKVYCENINKNIHLVGGIRNKRKDTLIKIYASKIANKFRSFILKDNCPDTGCGIKVFSKHVFVKIPFFNGLHRFLPALFLGLEYEAIFIKVNHRPREFGKSKYGIAKRFFYGLIDIYRVRGMIQKFKT